MNTDPKDIPIFIDGDEVVERPTFKDVAAFTAYISKISEGRDMILVVEHPHTEDDNVIAVYIGDESYASKCPQGCDS